jgi:trans-o-hydroxybenzylidenepyruvate hydratase-aldolase
MLRPSEIRGVAVMMITPATPDAGDWRTEMSVNLDESARAADAFVQAGVGSLALNGTTGECAALLWDEKLKFTETVVQSVNHRVPIFAGCTSLGTKETIRQMKAMRDIGAEGAFVGLPLWQTPTLENSIQWYADLSEAVPDMAIMVYSNAMFFKSDFPPPFWYGVAEKAPTVITCKITTPQIPGNFMDLVERTGDKITYVPGFSAQALMLWKIAPDHVNGLWATAANAAPEPLVAYSDALENNDPERAKGVLADIVSLPRHTPAGQQEHFKSYNVQAERMLATYSDFMNPGPLRPPYRDVPDDWRAAGKAAGEGWAGLRKKYAKAPAK